MGEMTIFNFPELMEDIHPQVEEILGILRRTQKNKSTLKHVIGKLDSKKHNQCDEELTRKEALILPTTVWGSSWVTEACWLI